MGGSQKYQDRRLRIQEMFREQICQLPRLTGSASKGPVGWDGVGWGGVGSYPLLSQAPTHVEVEFGCDNRVSTTKNGGAESNAKHNVLGFIMKGE
jgi:hypothetical protein